MNAYSAHVLGIAVAGDLLLSLGIDVLALTRSRLFASIAKYDSDRFSLKSAAGEEDGGISHSSGGTKGGTSASVITDDLKSATLCSMLILE